MWCKVNNRITPLEVCNTTSEEEDMEAMEDMKVKEHTKAKEGVEEHSVVVEDRSSAITMGSKVTMQEIARQLLAPIVKPSIMLLKSSWYF